MSGDNMRKYLIFIRVLLFLGLALTSSDFSFAQAAGGFGGSCKQGQVCDEGICDARSNICVPCGAEGQPACVNDAGAPYCSFPGYGYQPLQIGGRQQICFTRQTGDCGQVGLPACNQGDGPFCRYGVMVLAQGGAAFCGACGDFGQACCPNTDSPCDYGTCQNGTCLPDADRKAQDTNPAPKDNDAASNARQSILDAIADCRLSEARSIHAKADPNSEWYLEVSRKLVAAVERENDVSSRYERAKAVWAEAGKYAASGDYAKAVEAYARAREYMLLAETRSECPQTVAVIKEAIAMVDRANSRVEPGYYLELVRKQIRGCNFDLAGHLLDGVPETFPGRQAAQDLLDEALDRESRVMELHRAAKEIYSIAEERLRARKFKLAAEGLSDARDGFLKARQLTRCNDFRITIDEAIAVTGRKLDTASSLAEAEDRNGKTAPSSGDAKADQKPKPPNSASGPHPCLDHSVQSDASAGAYRQYVGGGGESYPVKGQFICGLFGDFSIFTGSELIPNKCKKEGNRLVNCKATRRITIQNVKQKNGSTEYFWKTGSDWEWISVVPRERQ